MDMLTGNAGLLANLNDWWLADYGGNPAQPIFTIINDREMSCIFIRFRPSRAQFVKIFDKRTDNEKISFCLFARVQPKCLFVVRHYDVPTKRAFCFFFLMFLKKYKRNNKKKILVMEKILGNIVIVELIMHVIRLPSSPVQRILSSANSDH